MEYRIIPIPKKKIATSLIPCMIELFASCSQQRTVTSQQAYRLKRPQNIRFYTVSQSVSSSSYILIGPLFFKTRILHFLAIPNVEF